MSIRNWHLFVSIAVAAVSVAFVWSYLPVLAEMAEVWAQNPLYSHGYFVPVFALCLLWLRREYVPALPLKPSVWAVAFVVVAAAMRLGAAHFYFSWPDRSSLLVMMIGAVLAIGGWRALRWAWPSILFLGFMLPFPGFMENGVMRPLQRVATICSTNVLQTLGFFAHADGNVIVLSEAEMGVVEACSGLRMLSTFVALTVGACFLLERPAWQKAVIALSSIPIALACNIARISATGVLYEVADHEFAQFVFHDVAGWLMMPMALVLLLLELKILDLVFEIAHRQPAVPAPAAATSNAVPFLGRVS